MTHVCLGKLIHRLVNGLSPIQDQGTTEMLTFGKMISIEIWSKRNHIYIWSEAPAMSLPYVQVKSNLSTQIFVFSYSPMRIFVNKKTTYLCVFLFSNAYLLSRRKQRFPIILFDYFAALLFWFSITTCVLGFPGTTWHMTNHHITAVTCHKYGHYGPWLCNECYRGGHEIPVS